MKDYYNILGVGPDATTGQIKAAFRRLAVRYHPDKNPDPQAEEIFKEINEAYNVLSDPNERAQYDWKRNPFNTLVTELEAEAAPQYRDPAYRKRARKSPVKQRPSDQELRLELMAQYLPYIQWVCWFSLGFGCIFFLDYVLPYPVKSEPVSQVSFVSERKGPGYQLIITQSGKKIKNYGSNYIDVKYGDNCHYSQTVFLKTVMNFSSGNEHVTIANVYGPLAVFPFALMCVALFGIYFRRHVERYFSASVICCVLLPMVFFLIFAL